MRRSSSVPLRLCATASAIAALSVGVALSASAAADSAARQDALTIASVTPEGPVSRGVEVAFTVDVDVTVRPGNEAVVRLGFNTENPNAWRMVTEQIVHEGRQRVLLSARVVPVDWRDRGGFSAFISLGPNSSRQAGRYVPTASVVYPIEVVP
jgi:hypothetical protein